ncbi:MAG: DNA-deoxyinosine glycosylase [Firmicutes bacterium]|nr:DNA-deoxyinosine glycosylase [Bacillota bacterium]MDD7601269.1 DNA-deoxyinosine glycosylase [Bacillota bacterium]MDY5856447.1 DNA-deoxyinosine glycosylase [Anaerovoracaceae bacterium]
MDQMHQTHQFEPVYDENSLVLILGTFPSVKSRENRFFYGHPQNRFWKVLAELTGEEVPLTIPDKKQLLLSHHIAVWDVVYSCDITGSSDSSIRNVVSCDLTPVLQESRIRAIFANGSTAAKLYEKYQRKQTGMEIIPLPSTSPANASCSLDKLKKAWSVIADYLQQDEE